VNSPDTLTIPLAAGAATTALAYEPSGPDTGASLILGHGAGAGQRSAFMVEFARTIASRGIHTVTFNFPYMEGGRTLPDKRPVLDSCYRTVIEAVAARSHRPLFIGGKSMGGRIATHVAAEDPTLPVAGLVLLGYPLHPPGKPDQRRDAHLPEVRRPTLIVQGSKDTFGTPQELEGVLERMTPRPVLHVIAGGDHSFNVSRSHARQSAVDAVIQSAITTWIVQVMQAVAETPTPLR
jgi:predicted alpha/beta-hydrolase family hydrolase